MTILVVADHDNSTLSSGTLNTLAAASAIGGEIHLLVAGFQSSSVADIASKIPCLKKVLVADSAAFENKLAENISLLVADLGVNYTHILASSSTDARSLMPRVAAMLDVDQVSDIIKVISADTFVRAIYAGNAIATIQSSATIKVITVRGTGFEPVTADGGSATIEQIDSTHDAGLSHFISEQRVESSRPDLGGC